MSRMNGEKTHTHTHYTKLDLRLKNEDLIGQMATSSDRGEYGIFLPLVFGSRGPNPTLALARWCRPDLPTRLSELNDMDQSNPRCFSVYDPVSRKFYLKIEGGCP